MHLDKKLSVKLQHLSDFLHLKWAELLSNMIHHHTLRKQLHVFMTKSVVTDNSSVFYLVVIKYLLFM